MSDSLWDDLSTLKSNSKFIFDHYVLRPIHARADFMRNIEYVLLPIGYKRLKNDVRNSIHNVDTKQGSR